MTATIQPVTPARADSHFVPLCAPAIGGNEWTYVKECLDTGWVSSVGSYVDRFERLLADRIGARFAVATSSGTSALHLALLAAGVKPDDIVLVSTLTFIAPANAVRYAGAWPAFIDAEPTYFQMDVNRVREFLERRCTTRAGLTIHRATGRTVRAIIPVHVLGHPVDMDPLVDLAREHELLVIEDATESLGAAYRGSPLGGHGDAACFSFNGNKLITTGGGGMLVTNDQRIADRARYLSTQAKDSAVEYVHGEIGYNYRLTNVQAAIGVAQLERLDEFVRAKRRLAVRYGRELQTVPGISPMQQAEWADSVFWLYTILVDPVGYGMSARQLLAALAEQGIQTRPLWQPMHISPAHPSVVPMDGRIAERLHRDALSLPCSVSLSDADQGRVVENIVALSHPAAELTG